MKRSEAVLLMCMIYQGLHRGGWSEASEEERMSEVLKGLEANGILPPKFLGKYDSIPTVTPTGQHEYSFVREWEPEDE